MEKVFNKRNFSTALALIPLNVFMRVARHYGYTDAAWMKAFLVGAALSLAIAGISVWRRFPVRDLLFAFILLFVTGAIAFLADIDTVIYGYKGHQGTSLMVWYLLTRAWLALRPGDLARFVYDPYAKVPLAAGIFAAAIFAWSFASDSVLVSVGIPMFLMISALYKFELAAPFGAERAG